MYRQLPRATSRKLSGHVCLSCRRHYNAEIQRQNHASDDWLSNFNDLSVAEETKSRSRRKLRDTEQKEEETQSFHPQKLEGVKAKSHIAVKDGKGETSSRAFSLDDTRNVQYPARTSGVDHDLLVSQRVRSAFESVLAAHGAKPLPESTAGDASPQDAATSEGARDGKLQATLERGHGGVQGNAGSSGALEFEDHFNELVREANNIPDWQNLIRKEGIRDQGDRVLNQSSLLTSSHSSNSPIKTWSVFDGKKGSNSTQSPDQSALSQNSSSNFSGSRFAFIKKIMFGSTKDEATPNHNPPNKIQDILNDIFEPNVQPAPLQKEGQPPQGEDGNGSPEPMLSNRAKSRLRREPRRLRKEAIAAALREVSKGASAPQKTEKQNRSSPKESVNPIEASQDQGESLAEAMTGRPICDAMNSGNGSQPPNEGDDPPEDSEDAEHAFPTIKAHDLHITALDIEQPPVPGLAYGLDKVLFNTGVTSLQDQHSRVYNFDPYLQQIMPVEEFDFNSLQQYKTSSQDAALSDLAKGYGKKYMGSTSSMTSTLAHFHFLLSNFRDLNLEMLSKRFPETTATFTAINRAPTAMFLRWKDGTYAIDADKEFDHGNVLMMLGKSMEKLLTMPKSDYERYRKSDPRQITEEERNAPEAYQYTTMGDFLMRSQLDAYDPRLPGTGMFDIKTRAVASIRMSAEDFKPMLGYELLTQQGTWESYEREYYDMMRSTMLKYMLQARMGRMDGIFLTYHNVQRIFGFQYLNMSEIDRAIHSQIDPCLGDQEFKISLDLLNKVLERATAKFPKQSLRFHFEARASPVTALYVFAEPMEEEQIDKIQSASKDRIADFERRMMGIEAKEDETDAQKQQQDKPAETLHPDEFQSHAPLFAATIIVASRVNGQHVTRPENLKPKDEWSVDYLFKEMEDPGDAWATLEQSKARRKRALVRAMSVDDEGGVEGDDPPEAANWEMHDEDGQVRTFENFFLEKLRKLAEQGREFRRKMDAAEEGREKVVWREGALEKHEEKGKDGKKEEEQEAQPAVNGAEDYMEWLFKDRKP